MCIMASEKNAITRNHPTLAVPNLRIRRNPYDGIVSCKPPASKLKKPKLFIQQPQTSYPQLSLIMSATGTCHCSELDTVHALFRSENQIQAFFNCRHLTGFCSASSRPSHLWRRTVSAGEVSGPETEPFPAKKFNLLTPLEGVRCFDLTLTGRGSCPSFEIYVFSSFSRSLAVVF